MYQLGLIICILSVVGGFVLEGGSLKVLAHSYGAILMIAGSALGVMIASSSRSLFASIVMHIKYVGKSSPYSTKDYTEVLVFMYFFFRFLRVEKNTSIEKVIEAPLESDLFAQFPLLLKIEEIRTFFCDYSRMLISDKQTSIELEGMMEQQIEVRKQYGNEVAAALYRIGDALPALGIIAAVLGMINVMSSFDQSPDVLGAKIGTALLGTFIGIALAYCFVNPAAAFVEQFSRDEVKMLSCIKAGFIAHINGNPPSVAVEFARQAIPMNYKPDFNTLERSIESKKQQIRIENGR